MRRPSSRRVHRRSSRTPDRDWPIRNAVVVDCPPDCRRAHGGLFGDVSHWELLREEGLPQPFSINAAGWGVPRPAANLDTGRPSARRTVVLPTPRSEAICRIVSRFASYCSDSHVESSRAAGRWGADSSDCGSRRDASAGEHQNDQHHASSDRRHSLPSGEGCSEGVRCQLWAQWLSGDCEPVERRLHLGGGRARGPGDLRRRAELMDVLLIQPARSLEETSTMERLAHVVAPWFVRCAADARLDAVGSGWFAPSPQPTRQSRSRSARRRVAAQSRPGPSTASAPPPSSAERHHRPSIAADQNIDGTNPITLSARRDALPVSPLWPHYFAGCVARTGALLPAIIGRV